MTTTLTELKDLCRSLSDELAFWINTPADRAQLTSEIEASRRLIDRANLALLHLQGPSEPAMPHRSGDLYHHFLRGNTIYWSCNEDLVAEAHRRAQLITDKGWPEPGPVSSGDIHPSRLGYAWHLAKATEVG